MKKQLYILVALVITATMLLTACGAAATTAAPATQAPAPATAAPATAAPRRKPPPDCHAAARPAGKVLIRWTIVLVPALILPRYRSRTTLWLIFNKSQDKIYLTDEIIPERLQPRYHLHRNRCRRSWRYHRPGRLAWLERLLRTMA